MAHPEKQEVHELAVCQSLIDQVEEIARREHALRVNRIMVRCGPLSGVEPDLLQAAFTIARAQGIAAHAILDIEPDPVVVRCDSCGREHTVHPNRLKCPVCDLPCPHLVSGDALLLASIGFERELQPSDPYTSQGAPSHV